MALKIQKVLSLLLPKYKSGYLTTLLLNCLILDQKLQNPEAQSFYFRKSLNASNDKLLKLEKEYESLRKYFNEMSVDRLIEKIHENEEKIRALDRYSYRSTNMFIAEGHYKSELAKYQELLALKAKVGALRPFRDYYNFPEELQKIIE